MSGSVPNLAAQSTAPLRLGVGIHDIPAQAYLDDPAVEPSLNASSAKVLIEKTPAHLKVCHPRLMDAEPERDEDAEPERETKEQRLGSIVHKLWLGQGKIITVCDYKNWRSDAAKQERADAAVRGELAVLPKELARAERIWDAARPQLERRFGRWPIGPSEQTLIWKRATHYGDIYCRAMLDQRAEDGSVVVDLKSTGRPLDDETIARKIAGEAAEVQNAHYTAGTETLFPDQLGRVEFWFVFIETDPPHLVRRKRLPESLLHLARADLTRASETFARCLRLGAWPGWREDAETLDPAGWHLRRLEERDMLASLREDA
jgi:hypothetical protein